MSNPQFQREPITIVRIDQPVCAHTFGAAPCAASGVACYATRATCRDAAAYASGSGDVVSLYFGKAGEGRPSDAIHLMPFLSAVSTAPAKINLSGADRNANPLGTRGSATIRFIDAPHTDRVVDPYRSTRDHDPLSRGTFWSKWVPRNKYAKVGALVWIYHGYAGDALVDMVARAYVCESIDFTGGASISMKCRDMLIKASDIAAQVPRLSPGSLFADVAEGALSIEVAEAVPTDYPATGTLRIGSEVMTYTSVVLNGSGRLDFTISARASDNTEPASHKAGDQVQECFRFDNEPIDDALERLFLGYTTIASEYLDLPGWEVEEADHLSAYRLEGLVTAPMAMKELLGEIAEQCQIFLWWDERAQLVKMRAVRAVTEPPRVLDEHRHILEDSVSIKEKPQERASQVWIYFDQIDPTGTLKAVENYRRVQADTRLDLEAPELYGEPAIRKIYARFLRTRAVALQTVSRILTRYQDVPIEAKFAVDAKDAGIEVGDMVRLNHFLFQDEAGAYSVRPWIVTSVEEAVPGERIVFTAEDASLSGVISVVMADGSPDWVGDGSDQFDGAWISDALGLMPDGSPGATIQ